MVIADRQGIVRFYHPGLMTLEDDLITLQTDVEVQQIDFKGQDFGTVRIDWLKLYRGIE